MSTTYLEPDACAPTAPSNAPRCPCCDQPVDPTRILINESVGLVSVAGRIARVKPLCARILRVLVDYMPGIAPKDEIYREIYGDRHQTAQPNQKIIDVALSQARSEFNRLGLVVETVWGVGYRLMVMPAGDDALNPRHGHEGSRPKQVWDRADDLVLRNLVGQGLAPAEIAIRMDRTYRVVVRRMRYLGLPDTVDADA